MRVPTLLALACAGTLSAQEAMAIGYGVQHRADETTRSLVDPDGIDLLDGGHYVYLGFSAPERAFVGWPWFDIEWNRNSDNGTRLDTVGVLYTERVPLWKFWLGGGVGTVYHDVHIGDYRSQVWRLGLKACAGFHIGGPLAVEASYVYADSAGGYKMDYYSLAALLRF